jgi:hypothetical protein
LSFLFNWGEDLSASGGSRYRGPVESGTLWVFNWGAKKNLEKEKLNIQNIRIAQQPVSTKLTI